MTVSQFLLGVVLYAAPMLAMKALARRFDVELGGVCGFWIVVLVLACAASTTVTVVAGWQWVAVGTVIAILGSFFFANVIVG